MNRKYQAFTLVELLVVITIIGILAGIALPVFQKAQEKSRAISDASNLRQLGIGVQAYKGDYSGNMPDGATADTDPKIWPQQLNPTYISAWKVFKSPFDSRPNSEDKTKAPVSYGMNGEGTGILGVDTSKFNYPSNLIMFAPKIVDSPTLSYDGLSNADVIVKSDSAGTGDRGSHLSRRHINVLYADGHTEDILFTKFKDKTTVQDGPKRWIFDTYYP